MESNGAALYEFHAVDESVDDEFCRSADLQRLYTRRRSISLTSEVDPELISALVAKVRSNRGQLRTEAEGEDPAVSKRRNLPKRNTSDPKRPSSMLVHDNEELLQLADELHLRDLQGDGDHDWKPKSGRRSSTCAGYLLYQTVSDDQSGDPGPKSRTLTQKDIDALRRISVCSGRPTDGVPLKLSQKPASGKLASLGHLFGTSGKRGGGSGGGGSASANVGGVQSKIAKKMERQLSKEGGVTGVEQRREQFLQTRSNTGLNFFRRRSVAVTEDPALRSAKSHLDLAADHADEQQKPAQEAVRPTEPETNVPIKNSLQRKFGSRDENRTIENSYC
jgi:hypothetical protein